MADNKKEIITMVTPKGSAMWAKVNTVIDEYKGKKKYSIKVELPEKDEKKLIADIQKLYKEAQALPEYKGKEWRYKPRLGFKPDKTTGKIQFSFWTYAFNKDKEGNDDTQKTIKVSDRYGRNISDKTIGNGSIIKVSFNPSVYYESEDSNGITLYLRQIVVYDLVEYNTDGASDFEFEELNPEDVDEEISI